MAFSLRPVRAGVPFLYYTTSGLFSQVFCLEKALSLALYRLRCSLAKWD